MQNLKPTVAQALASDATLVALVGDNVFPIQPPEKSAFPCVTYYEGDNRDYPFGDDLEHNTEIIMIVECWVKEGSTSEIAQAVDGVMQGLGFYREFSTDLVETKTGVKQKHMRYRKLKVFTGATTDENGNVIVYVDPWADALATWTQERLPGWQSFVGAYPERYERPCVIWLPTHSSAKAITSGAYEVEKRFLGIVLGDTPYSHISASNVLVGDLAMVTKIPVDVQNKRYITVKDVSSDTRQDSITVAHIRLDAYRHTMAPQEEVTAIERVYANGKAL